MTLNTEYSFLDVIAKGAYGRVYKVQNRENKQVYALKVIGKAKIVTENAVTQAKQEVLRSLRTSILLYVLCKTK